MKTLLVIALLCTGLMYAQEKTYTVKESQLTAQQKASLTIQEQQQNVSSWVGVGKEVGTAMREGLSALNTEVNKFSESPAGQFTMFVIAYKVIGNDVFHFIIGFPFLVIGFFVWVFFYWKNCTVRRVVVKSEGPWFHKTKEYKIINEADAEIDQNRWGHFAGLVVFLAASMLMLFSGGCGGSH